MSNENGKTIHVTEKFAASKEALYKAWTEQDQLKQWWKPLNKKLETVENDIREGGIVRYEFEGDLTVEGEYKEVDKKNRLVYTWKWDFPEESLHKGEYLLTVVFGESGEGSTIDITQENFEEEHAVKPHQQGWNESLKALKNHLSS